MVTACPSFVEIANPFLNVVVVVYLRRVLCPRAEGGAYNSTGQGARTCNTFRALWRPEGSKAPIPSFPGSTFPSRAQGMVLGAMVDPNVLSRPVPIVMRDRYRSGRGSFWAVGWRPIPISWARLTLSLRGRARRNLSLSLRAGPSPPYRHRARRRLALSLWGEAGLSHKGVG